jgi:cysteine synthase
MFVLRDDVNISGGPSSGVNFLASLHMAASNRSNRDHLSIATIVNDGGDRYNNTYYQERWIEQNYANRGGVEV